MGGGSIHPGSEEAGAVFLHLVTHRRDVTHYSSVAVAKSPFCMSTHNCDCLSQIKCAAVVTPSNPVNEAVRLHRLVLQIEADKSKDKSECSSYSWRDTVLHQRNI